MNASHRSLTTVACWILFLGTARGHPGHEHVPGPAAMKVWVDSSGRIQTRGDFVATREGLVMLRQTDGVLVSIPLDKLGRDDREWIQNRVQRLHELNAHRDRMLFAQAQNAKSPVDERADDRTPAAAKAFAPFKTVKVRWDRDYLYVESNGLPEHNMMVGIRAWQQQVPLPQPYTGHNAWRIPLNPKLADRPVSARTSLYRGAIALAVNGVPIFNALNNRGEDAYLAGELDEWGGHCGRGDDYHYHIAPLHLEKTVGKGNPIAYALDGFPIYGLTEADGSPVGKLDEFNGQFDANGNYHYHATKTYPYINGGIRGVVEVRGDQIEPQPRDAPVRPGQSPLRGATITEFKSPGESKWSLTYKVGSETRRIDYEVLAGGKVRFDYVDGAGRVRTETYTRREPDPAGRGGDRPPPPPRDGDRGTPKGQPKKPR